MLTSDLALGSATATVFFASGSGQRFIDARVVVENVGDARMRGNPSLNFFLSTDDTIGPTDISLGNLLVPTRMVPTQRFQASLKVPVPHDLSGVFHSGNAVTPGEYRVLVSLNTGGAADSSAANNSAVASGRVTVSYDFGDVGEISPLRLNAIIQPTEQIIVVLTGPGTGELVTTNGARLLRVRGTDLGTRLVVKTPNKFISATLSGIDIQGSIGRLELSDKVAVVGDVTIAGSARQIKLGSVSNGSWRIDGSSGLVDVRLTAATNVSLSSAQAIKVLSATSWTTTDTSRDAIVAPRIDTLLVASTFSADLSISGRGAPTTSIRNLVISGAVSGRWDITGNVANLTVGSVSSGFAANIQGRLTSWISQGNMDGLIAAASIGRFEVRGNLTNSVVLAGANLGPDAAIGGTGSGADVYGPGSIDYFSVLKAMTNVTVAAGLNPGDTLLLTADDRFVDDLSFIARINVRSTMTSTTFAAPKLPRQVSLGGHPALTAGDSRFKTTLP